MAISRITAQDASGTGTTSATATYAAIPTNRNLLIAVVGSNDGVNPSATIPGWTFVNSGSVGTAIDCSIFYKIATASELTVVTATQSTASIIDIAIYEYTGIYTTTKDRVSSSSSTGLAVSTGTTLVTRISNDLIIAGVMWPSVAQTLTSWSASFTPRLSVGTHLFTADLVATVTNAYASTCTVTGTSAAAVGVIVAFANNGALSNNNYQFVRVGDGMSVSEKIR